MAPKKIKNPDSDPATPVVEVAPPTRTRITLIASEKGGLGKTMTGLTVACQMTAANHPFYLIDADASTPNVGLTYRREIYQHYRELAAVKAADLPESIDKLKSRDRQITFTGNNSEYFLADRIFDLAKKEDVLIVLPSQVAAYVKRWLDQNDALGMLSDPNNTIDIVYLFITNGTPESIDLFKESVAAFDGKIPHVLVKNLGAATNINWDWFDEDGSVQALLEKYKYKSIKFPELLLAPDDKNKILSEYIPFDDAINSDWISFSSKRRLTKWVREATQALASTDLFPYHPSYPLNPPTQVQAGSESIPAVSVEQSSVKIEKQMDTSNTSENPADEKPPF